MEDKFTQVNRLVKIVNQIYTLNHKNRKARKDFKIKAIAMSPSTRAFIESVKIKGISLEYIFHATISFLYNQN